MVLGIIVAMVIIILTPYVVDERTMMLSIITPSGDRRPERGKEDNVLRVYSFNVVLFSSTLAFRP